jgi:hypothetical protein
MQNQKNYDSKSNGIRIFVLILVLVFVGYFFFGKGMKKEEIPQQAENKSPQKPGVEFMQYPDDFPKDLAIFIGLFDESSRYKDTSGTDIISVTYTMKNDLKAMVSVFKYVLGQAKWSIDEKTTSTGELLTVTKEKMRAEITINSTSNTSSQVHLLYFLPK